MDITFVLDDLGTEAEALAAITQSRLPEEDEHLWGGVVIAHPGQPTLALRDDLQAIAATLFGAVAARVRAGEAADLALASWDGLWQWRPHGADAVQVTAPDGVQAVYPRTAMADALAACGRRLVVCLDAMGVLSPRRVYAAQALAAALDAGG
jgi:hypothetical protein